VTDGRTGGQNYDSQDRASIARAVKTVIVERNLFGYMYLGLRSGREPVEITARLHAQKYNILNISTMGITHNELPTA